MMTMTAAVVTATGAHGPGTGPRFAGIFSDPHRPVKQGGN